VRTAEEEPEQIIYREENFFGNITVRAIASANEEYLRPKRMIIFAL
jgi:hypothetical protein